jgi:uncharacterized protein (TIGR03545 family)
MLKVIKWGKVAQLIIGVVIILVLNSFLLGFLMKLGIEKGGEAAFGAKTQVSSLILNLFNGKLDINRIQIANKKDPWKNIVEIGGIHTGVNTEQLLYKRFVLDKLTIDSIMLGTTRNSSGALPIKIEPPKKAGEGVDFKKMTAALQIDPAKAAKKVTEVGPLESKEQFAKISADNEKKLAETNQKVNSYKPDEEVKKIDFTVLNNISDIKSLPELQEKLKKVEELSKQVNGIQKNFDVTKTLADANLKGVQDNLNLLADLKNKDLNKIFDKLNLGNYDLKTIGRSMLGPKINGYIDTGVQWMTMAQKYMPPKKPKPKKRDRFKGQTIVFANKGTLPKFLIRLIGLNGTTAQGTVNELKYSGKVTDITSDPVLLGKPMVIDIQGKFVQDKNSLLKILGKLDHTKDTASDTMDFVISGYKMDGQKLWDEKTIPLSIKKGTGVIKGNIGVVDEELTGKISFIGRNMVYEKLVADKDSLESIAADAIRGAKEINAEIILSGSLDNPNIKITTNLDRIIGDQLNKVVGEKLDAVKKQVTAEYEKQVGAAQKDAEAKIAAQQKEIKDTLAKQQAAIDTATNDLKAKQDEIQKQIEDQKNAATKAVSGEVDKLKGNLPKGLKF